MASPSKSRTNNLEIQYTKSPMVGGQLECLVGLTKHSLKNRPLTYVEDDIQLNVLIPNSMILGKDARTVNFSAGGNSDEWTKRQRYTAQKMKLSIKDFFSKCDQITFTEEILNRKLHFLCSDMYNDVKKTRGKDGNMNT